MSFKVYETKTYQNCYNEWGEADKDEITQVRKILTFLAANLRRASNRSNFSQIIEVDLDYVYEIGERQDWLCALTGEDLEFTRGGTYWGGKWCNPKSCTIDRIDSSKGYIEGNIQLVTWEANFHKQNIPNDEFIEFCEAVTWWNK